VAGPAGMARGRRAVYERAEEQGAPGGCARAAPCPLQRAARRRLRHRGTSGREVRGRGGRTERRRLYGSKLQYSMIVVPACGFACGFRCGGRVGYKLGRKSLQFKITSA
jgi:hypothetical protein